MSCNEGLSHKTVIYYVIIACIPVKCISTAIKASGMAAMKKLGCN